MENELMWSPCSGCGAQMARWLSFFSLSFNGRMRMLTDTAESEPPVPSLASLRRADIVHVHDVTCQRKMFQGRAGYRGR